MGLKVGTTTRGGLVISTPSVDGERLNVKDYILAIDADATAGFTRLVAAMASTGKSGYVPGKLDGSGNPVPYKVRTTWVSGPDQAVFTKDLVLEGDGPGRTLIQAVGVTSPQQGEHRLFRLGTSGSPIGATFRDMTLMGQDETMPTSGETQLTATAVAGISGWTKRVLCENVHFLRFSWGIKVSGELTCRNCVFDGQINTYTDRDTMGLLHGEDATLTNSVTLDTCVFRNNGSTFFKPFSHDVYLSGGTNLRVTGCRFESHLDGRNITMHGSTSVTTRPLVTIEDTVFEAGVTSGGQNDQPAFLGNSGLAPLLVAFRGCVFKGRAAQMTGSTTFESCRFTHAGTTPVIEENNPLPAGPHKLRVTNCIFDTSASGQDIYLAGTTTWDYAIAGNVFTGTHAAANISILIGGYDSDGRIDGNTFGEPQAAGKGPNGTAIRLIGGWASYVRANRFYHAGEAIKIAGGASAGQQIRYLRVAENDFSQSTGPSYSVVSNGPTNYVAAGNFGTVGLADTALTAAFTAPGVTSLGSVNAQRSANSQPALNVGVTGFANYVWNVRADGRLGWGPSDGSATQETFLERSVASTLKLTGKLTTTLGVVDIDLGDITGLTSAQIDALAMWGGATPTNGTAATATSSSNRVVARRLGGKWYTTAALSLIA